MTVWLLSVLMREQYHLVLSQEQDQAGGVMLSCVTTPDPDETPIQRFRMPLESWLAFGRVCQQQGIPRARCLFDLAWSYVLANGTEADAAVFAENDRELRARRSRKPVG